MWQLGDKQPGRLAAFNKKNWVNLLKSMQQGKMKSLLTTSKASV